MWTSGGQSKSFTGCSKAHREGPRRTGHGRTCGHTGQCRGGVQSLCRYGSQPVVVVVDVSGDGSVNSLLPETSPVSLIGTTLLVSLHLPFLSRGRTATT